MTPIAFIGLGIMGHPMAGHLLAAGHPLTVNTRTKGRAGPLLERGATWADTPADAARAADVVFVCVPDTPDVEAVVYGRDGRNDGIVSAAREGLIVVDHSTISPSATRRMAEALATQGARLLDAPVSGGDVGARNATLSIMVGGDPSAFDQARPMLERMGKTITYCGPSGSGQLTKLVNQVLVSLTNLAVSEALTFAKAADLDLNKTLAAVGGGAAGSWQLANLGPRMVAGDFAPGFMIKLQQKDLRLVLEAAKEMGLDLAGLNLVHGLFGQAMAEGAQTRGRRRCSRWSDRGQTRANPEPEPPKRCTMTRLGVSSSGRCRIHPFEVPMRGMIDATHRWLAVSAVVVGGSAILVTLADRQGIRPPSRRHAANAVTRPATQPATRPAHPFRSNVKVEVTDDFFIVHSNGIPDHDTGVFPGPHNPNKIREQNYAFKIPRHPKLADKVTRTPMGPIGVAINGVPFYNPYNREGEDAARMEVFDECCGHPDPMGRYHYHIYPKCIHTSFTDAAGEHSPLIGFAFDGFGVYGPNADGGKPPTDLDECNGHADKERGYHYHVTKKFPYLIGGYHGEVDPANFDRRPPRGPEGPGGPGGRRPPPGPRPEK